VAALKPFEAEFITLTGELSEWGNATLSEEGTIPLTDCDGDQIAVPAKRTEQSKEEEMMNHADEMNEWERLK
jgi:hypothetical protein